jgi:polyhydroxyalkanoate synthesis repressor PhaR
VAKPTPGPGPSPRSTGAGVRLIKRYANRKLYDTGSGELTSMRRIEELLRDGLDIRVVDHDTGEDMTSEVLVGILGNSISDGTIEGDILLLTSLIRSPDDLVAAMMQDEQRTDELRAMGERVRVLSATIDALLGQMDQSAAEEPPAAAPPKPRPAKAQPTKSSGARKRAGQARTPRS